MTRGQCMESYTVPTAQVAEDVKYALQHPISILFLPFKEGEPSSNSNSPCTFLSQMQK